MSSSVDIVNKKKLRGETRNAIVIILYELFQRSFKHFKQK